MFKNFLVYLTIIGMVDMNHRLNTAKIISRLNYNCVKSLLFLLGDSYRRYIVT